MDDLTDKSVQEKADLQSLVNNVAPELLEFHAGPAPGYYEIIARAEETQADPSLMLGERMRHLFRPGELERDMLGISGGGWSVDQVNSQLREVGANLHLLAQNVGEIAIMNGEPHIQFPVYNASGQMLYYHQVSSKMLKLFSFEYYFARRFSLIAGHHIYPLVVTSNPFYTMAVMAGGQYSFAVSPYFKNTELVSDLPINFMGRDVSILARGFDRRKVFYLVAQLLAAGAKVSLLRTPDEFGSWLQSFDCLAEGVNLLMKKRCSWEKLPGAVEADLFVEALCSRGMNAVLLDQCLIKLAKVWEVPFRSVKRLIKQSQIECLLLKFLEKRLSGMTLRELKSALRSVDKYQLQSAVNSLLKLGLIKESPRKGCRGPATTSLKIAGKKSPEGLNKGNHVST